MIKHVIVLPNGKELSSGTGTRDAIMKVTTTESVNIGEELTLGSAFANILEATVLLQTGEIYFTAGMEVTLYTEDESGTRVKHGVYVLEKPSQVKSKTVSVVGYDRMIKLDKDLSSWVDSLTGWPYRLIDFARLVCNQCGLTLATTTIPNASFPVVAFQKSGVTGRDIMRWIGEACGRFVRATPDGAIEFAWYEESNITITPGGNYHYFANSLSYDTYTVIPVDSVRVRLSSNSGGVIWPDETSNPYIIENNPILMGSITYDISPFLDVIYEQIESLAYKPCKVSIPATPDIKAGHIVAVSDINGEYFKTIVMTKNTIGQRDTLEGTGSRSRNDPSALSNFSNTTSADRAASDAVAAQTQDDVFNKLTKNGTVQGIFFQNDQWYINCAVANVVNINASNIKTGTLNAELINANQLMAKDIEMSGSLSQSVSVFFEPGAVELERMYNGITGEEPFADDEYALYDFDSDGEVTLADYMLGYKAMIGERSLSAWRGAQKTTATAAIDLKYPSRALRITGTNMWGRVVTHSIGLSTLFSDGNSAKTFDLMLKQSDGYSEIIRRLEALE